MDKKDFESLLNKYPDCVSDGKKLSAFLKDLYPDVPKAILNTLTIMADDGIISEMQKAGQTPLVSARLQKKLEDDYGLSQKIIAECFLLIIYDSAKQPQTTNNARPHENINVSAHTTSKSASKKENFPQNTTKSGKKPLSQSIPAKGKTTKQTNTNFAFDPKDFEIENGTLKKYKGSSSVVVIPNSVTSIGDYAFYGCRGLTSITISDSVTSIGYQAFYNCSRLTSVTIPDSVTIIGNWAFYGCKLQDIYITDIAAWCNISGLDNLMVYGSSNKNLYINNEPATSITIPDGVTAIPSSAFAGCSGLTSITIPNSVTIIDRAAFYKCTGLTSVTIPDSVTSIGGDAFYNTAWYNNQPNGLVYAGKVAYEYKGTMPSDTSIVLKEGTLGVANYAFSSCSGLASVTIPDSVTSIGWYAFKGCTGLTNITIPDSVTSIGGDAFRDCTGLTSVTIGNGVSSIGEWAFSGCSGLTSIIIPNSVTSIGKGAFFGCSGLTSVTIPDSVTSIGFSAFEGCTGLTSIIIPDSVTSIGIDAFHNTAWYNNQPNGLVYAGKVAYKYKGTMPSNTSIVLKEGTLGIADYAFFSCSGLASMTIPNSVTSIGGCAFRDCTGLTSITIPDSVTSIGYEAFSGCRNLTIYCEAESKPIGWSSYWNPGHRLVVCGMKK